MKIAQELRERNVAEYLLYMWQQEDLLRAFDGNIERLEHDYLSQFQVTDEEHAEMRQWYADLAEMMHDEGVMASGHVQVNKNIIILLNDLHTQLLHSPKHPFYSAAYYKALPFIVELRQRSQSQEKCEIENCFDALYGLMLLRLQGKPVSDETQQAMGHISHLLGLLSDYEKKDKAGTLEV